MKPIILQKGGITPLTLAALIGKEVLAGIRFPLPTATGITNPDLEPVHLMTVEILQISPSGNYVELLLDTDNRWVRRSEIEFIECLQTLEIDDGDGLTDDDNEPSSWSMSLQPHQQRVVTERDELQSKLDKLAPFLNSATYASLESAEQGRLRQQFEVMIQYRDILDQRLAAFSPSEHAGPTPSPQVIQQEGERPLVVDPTSAAPNAIPASGTPEDVDGTLK